MRFQSGTTILGFVFLQLSNAVPLAIPAPVIEARSAEAAKRPIVTFAETYSDLLDKREVVDAKRPIVTFAETYSDLLDKREVDAKRPIVTFAETYSDLLDKRSVSEDPGY